MKNATTGLQAVEEMPGNWSPFVNEECGDTMWDNVLKEAEEKQGKPGSQVLNLRALELKPATT